MCIKEQGNEYLNRTEKTRQNKTYSYISAVTETNKQKMQSTFANKKNKIKSLKEQVPILFDFKSRSVKMPSKSSVTTKN